MPPVQTFSTTRTTVLRQYQLRLFRLYNLKEDITSLCHLDDSSSKAMAWTWVVTLLLVALPQVQAAPWTVWACEGGSGSTTVAPASGAGSCCVWTGDSNGASMHPASASASCSDARAPCGLAASPDGHARTLGLSASGVCAGAPLVRTRSCPGFTGQLYLGGRGITLINPDAFDECGAT